MPLDWRSVKSFHPQEPRNGKISFLLLFPSGDLLWPTPATCTQEAWDAIQKCRGRRRIKGGLERAQAPQHFSNDHHTITIQWCVKLPLEKPQKLRHLKALQLCMHVCLVILFGPKRIKGTKGMFTHLIQRSHFAAKCHF